MNLKFGTGGLRATMAPGPDHLNIETIREATLGVADYAATLTKRPKVAIAYDSRLHSEEFARETARVLAVKGCQAFLYPQLMPTPALSFAVRALNCDLGISITASHNPKDYNGYKVYGSDGCQITSAAAKAISQAICEAAPLEISTLKSFEELLQDGNIVWIEDETAEQFLAVIAEHRIRQELNADLKVVYTPLNGAGRWCITKILEMIGVKEVHLVEEQTAPDGNFPTCPYPNPEELEALQLGLELCQKTDADILLASDPDSDRIGVAAKRNGVYERLNGNQVGILLLDYLLKAKKQNKTMPKHPVVIKTIVTTAMAEKIAESHGVEVINTLTGFKYIGEQIGLLEAKGERDRYLFGFEESCGYLIGTYVRDKDAVGAAMMVCEMADAYKAEGKTLWDVMEELYETYGRYETELETHKFDGAEAARCMQQLRDALTSGREVRIKDSTVERYEDYQEGIGNLPKSNVLKLWMKDESQVVIRPSGTEPKIKVYTEKYWKS